MQSITAEQSRAARRELGLSQADVTNALGFNRQYLSDFETGFSTRLTDAQLKKLCAFYQAKIQEANSQGEEISIPFNKPEPERAPAPKVEAVRAKRLAFPVADNVSDETLAATLNTISDNDHRLAELLVLVPEREKGIFGDGDYTEDALAQFREAFSLLATNYLLIRAATGWPALGLSASNINLAGDTLLAKVIGEFKSAFDQAGLLTELAPEQEDQDAKASA